MQPVPVAHLYPYPVGPNSPARSREVINAGKDGGASALYLAAQNGHAEVVEYLIHCNARTLDAKLNKDHKSLS